MGNKTALEASRMNPSVARQFAFFAMAELLLYLSYQHHDSRFHWFLHFFAGTSAALIVMTLVTYWSNRTILFPFLWVLIGHTVAMFPDILWSAELLPHQHWMDIFVFHISSHFIPGRNWTWYVIFLLCLALYLYARQRQSRLSQDMEW
jgi:hypothetical protein